MRLLFVDDNILFAGVATSLYLESCEVTYAQSLCEARARLETGHFEVVLVSSELGDGAGEELIREIRPSFAGAIITLTDGHPPPPVDAGADGSCSKAHFRVISAVITAALWRRAGLLHRNGAPRRSTAASSTGAALTPQGSREKEPAPSERPERPLALWPWSSRGGRDSFDVN